MNELIERIETLEVDESAIAIVLSSPGLVSPEQASAINDEFKRAIPKLKIPVLLLFGGMRLNVLKASDAKTLRELIETESL